LGHVCRVTTWSKKKPRRSPGLKSKENAARGGAAMIIARRKKGAAEADDGRI